MKPALTPKKNLDEDPLKSNTSLPNQASHRHCPRQWLVRHLRPHRGQPGLRQHQRSRRQQPGQEQPLRAQLLDITGEAGGDTLGQQPWGQFFEQPKIRPTFWLIFVEDGSVWKLGAQKFNLGNMMMKHQFLHMMMNILEYFLARWKYAQQHKYLNFTCKHADQDQHLWHNIFGGMNINLYTSYYNRDGYQQ